MLKDYVPHVHPTLRYLTLPGDSIWHAPQHVFSGLHELSLHNPAGLEDFNVILQHCSQLRTLNLRIDNWDCSDELFAALEAAPDSLPHLTSFKLLCDNDVFDFVPLTLTTFFKNKPMMRRLDLRFELLFEDVDELAYFLDIIAGLPRLEVIGLRLECADFTHEHLQLLDARLPLHLSALLLAWAFDPDYGSNTVAERDWIAMVRPKAPSPDLSLTVPPLHPISSRDASRWATSTSWTTRALSICAMRCCGIARAPWSSSATETACVVSSATQRPARHFTGRPGRRRRSASGLRRTLGARVGSGWCGTTNGTGWSASGLDEFLTGL